MVGALADWFAVVALFRHPLGIPIWHTAIIPRKKDEIGRNLGGFVESRLLSVENLSVEISAFFAIAHSADVPRQRGQSPPRADVAHRWAASPHQCAR